MRPLTILFLTTAVLLILVAELVFGVWAATCAILIVLALNEWGNTYRRKQRALLASAFSGVSESEREPWSVGSAFMLPTGRLLGYRIVGVEQTNHATQTLVYLHGTPGSRHEMYPDERILIERNIRLITIDRPGFGKSTYDPNRTRVSFADDIASLLLDELHLTRCGMMGFSGGGAYVLACLAHPRLRSMITTATLIAGEGPFYQYPPQLLASIRRHSPMLYLTSWLIPLGELGRDLLTLWFEYEQYCFLANPRAFLTKKYGARLTRPPPSTATAEEFQSHANMYDMLIRLQSSVWLEPFQSCAVKASLQDCVIAKSRWEFQLEEIGENTNIFLWHGEKDNLRSFEVSNYMAKRLTKAKNVTVRTVPNGGHALFLRRENWIQMLEEIIHSQ